MSSSITHRQNREHPHLGKKKKKGIGDGRTDCDKHVQCLARKMNTFMCEQHSILSLIPFLSFINPSPLIPFPHFCPFLCTSQKKFHITPELCEPQSFKHPPMSSTQFPNSPWVSLKFAHSGEPILTLFSLLMSYKVLTEFPQGFTWWHEHSALWYCLC